MTCSECGAEMNHHAMKVAYEVVDQTSIDPDFDGALEEVHTCPRCSFVAVRPAQ